MTWDQKVSKENFSQNLFTQLKDSEGDILLYSFKPAKSTAHYCMTFSHVAVFAFWLFLPPGHLAFPRPSALRFIDKQIMDKKQNRPNSLKKRCITLSHAFML